MTAPFRFPRFFVTSPSPCPYLPAGRNGRSSPSSPAPTPPNSTTRSAASTRRSQSVAYRPSCAGCAACVSVRVLTRRFEPNATQRKLMRRHADLDVSACRPWATAGSSSCCATISRCGTPAAACRAWTTWIMPTWWSSRRSIR
ncbi:hypothetical protein AB5I41_11650 [Sphingomonas sp. MMS24-JH45]